MKGQLSLLVPQPEVTYRASGRVPGSGGLPPRDASMNPRRDGIVIGNLMDRGNWTLQPDEDVRRQNVEAAIRFFAAMRPPARGAQLTRSEPPQAAPGLESFFGEES